MVFTDAQRSVLEPLVEACRPHAKVPPSNLRRTVEAIVWRCQNGAKWRAVPAELGPWWMAAQTFICWACLGVWDRLLDMAKAKGVELGLVFLDGTSIRAHAKAAGASKKGDLEKAATAVKRLSALPTSLRGIGQSPIGDLAAAIGALRRSGPDREPTALPSAGAPRLS